MKQILALAGLGLLILAVFSGCMFGLTLEQRIQRFASDLNTTARTEIQDNFHPSFTVDYAAIGNPGYFSIPFPPRGGSDTSYVIAIQDSSNETAVLATIDGTALPVTGPVDAIFSMALDGLDYKIVNLRVDWGSGMVWVVQ